MAFQDEKLEECLASIFPRTSAKMSFGKWKRPRKRFFSLHVVTLASSVAADEREEEEELRIRALIYVGERGFSSSLAATASRKFRVADVRSLFEQVALQESLIETKGKYEHTLMFFAKIFCPVLYA